MIDVSERDYKTGRAKGIPAEMLLEPGRHRFVRGINPLIRAGLLPATAPKKVRITILLDEDVLAHFKQRAARPNALPYQTQINRELRAAMMQDRGVTVETEDDRQALVNDPDFIRAVAERVGAQGAKAKRRGKRAA